MMHARRDALADSLKNYRARFPGESAVVDLFLELLDDWPLCLSRTRLAGHLTGSAFVTAGDVASRTPASHVLLVHHRKLGIWVQPGGHADGVGDLSRVARTELSEETGLTGARLASASIFDIDRHSIPARPGVPAHFHYDVRYHFTARATTQPVVSDESHDVKWVRITDVPGYTTEESINRRVRKLDAEPTARE